MENDSRLFVGRAFGRTPSERNVPKRGTSRRGGKYHKGEKLNPHEALAAILAGKPVFWYSKIQNAKWLIHHQIKMVVDAAEHGILYAAVWVAKLPKKAKSQGEK